MGRALTLLFEEFKNPVIITDKIEFNYSDDKFLDIFEKVEDETGIDCPQEGVCVHNVIGSNVIKKSVLVGYGIVKGVLCKDLKKALKGYPKSEIKRRGLGPAVAYIKASRNNQVVYLYWS